MAMFETLVENGYYPNPSNDSVNVVIVLVAMGLMDYKSLRIALMMWCDLDASDEEA